MNPREEWERWVSWLGERAQAPTIFEDVLAMVASRQIWDTFRIVYEHAPEEAKENDTFVSWLTQNYVRAQGTAIRRQVDTGDTNISIGRLLRRVEEHAEILSRENYAARVSGWASREEADREFDQWVGRGRDHIDPAIPRDDLDRLQAGTEGVRKWVNKEVAHYDKHKGRFGTGLTHSDVDTAIDLVVDTAIKYRSMIMGAHMTRDISMLAWEAIFRVPWISDSDHWDHVGRLIRESVERRRG